VACNVAYRVHLAILNAARNSLANAIVAADLPPCFQALRFPFGAPLLFPPCILHRRFPFTAGDWHSAPERVRAKQRGADASRSGCMGLIVEFSISSTPGIDVLRYDGLPAAIINMDVTDHLFAAAPHPGQRLHLALRCPQQLCRHVAEHLHVLNPFGLTKLAEGSDGCVMGDVHLDQQKHLGLTLRRHAVDEGERGIVARFGASAD
jgi:hypothetical protein